MAFHIGILNRVAGSYGFLYRDLEAPWMKHAGILTLYGFSYRDLDPTRFKFIKLKAITGGSRSRPDTDADHAAPMPIPTRG